MALSNNNQAAFWEAMKEKYEKRNENLRQQETCLRERLEQLKQLMEKQQTNDDCDCVPEKLEKPSLVQCLVQKGKDLILGSCTCGDPKFGQELLCACHIIDPSVPLNFDSKLCPNETTLPPEGCLNKECEFYNPQLANPPEDPSIFSLKTTDIYYMDKLAELVKTEKCMQNKITDLENKERCYVNALQDLNEAMKNKPKNDPLRREFDRIVECLEGENRKLKNELEDLRLELKHCFERVEGPLRRSLENQREKCVEMEKKLKTFQGTMTNKEDNYLKEINEIKAKLCQACCTMVDLNNINLRLKNDLVSLENKCLTLEDELVKQQLKEAENILKFKKAICRRSAQVDSFNRGDDTEQDLENIARQLSETLKEVYPCVTKIPTELTETVKGIKQLTEFVGEKEAQRRKKRNEKAQNSIMPSTSQIESFCCCYNIEDSYPESTVSAKIICTKPQTPVQDIESEKQVPATVEKTADNIVETASKACECEIEYECRSQQTPEKQTSNNVEDAAQSVCTCEDQESRKTGPSEEVLSVTDLEPFCPAGVCDLQMQKLKLKVDTTRDIIDMAPDDIHVVTTLAKTGSLEIRTEGPPGIIETKVNYLPCGKIEIVTKLIDRNKLTSFLDGTLLSLPDRPPETQCNESQTCGGQCDLPALDSAQIEQEEQKPTNETIPSDQLPSSGPYGSVNVLNNFVLLSKTRMDPLIPNEWKNNNFNNDPTEEFDSTSIMSNVRRMHKHKEEIYLDEGTDNEFRLSSRPSLTDIEKYSQDNGVVTGESLIGFTHPDALETISEDDEDDYSNSEHTSEAKETVCLTNAWCNTSKHVIDYASSDLNINNEDTLNFNETRETCEIVKRSGDESESLEQENIPSERKEIIIAEDGYLTNVTTSSNDEINDSRAIAVIASLPIKNTNSLGKLLDHDKPPEECLWGNGDVCASIHTEEQSSGSFCHLYRNFGNINLLKGNFRLRQTKSLYENKRRGTESLRVCKSAVINLGTLKIDIEMIKFLPGGPTSGDFDAKKTEDKEKDDFKNSRSPVLEIENNKEPLYPENDEVIPQECKKEGYNSPDLKIIPEKIYQCFVCNCSKKEEKQDASETIRPPRTEGLEERIDRLLQVNPFATSHGPDCQCVDCLIHKSETNSPSTIPPTEGCKCTSNLRDKTNNAYPEMHRCKCTLKKQETSTENELELSKQGDTIQHDENCTCVDCLCNPSNFKISKCGAKCDCKDCKCGTCYDSSKNPLADISLFQFTKPPEITVMNVIVPCDCGASCICSPCLDSNKATSKAPQSQGDKNKSAYSAEPQTRSSILQQPSINNPFNNRDTWKNVVGCPLPPGNKKEVCDCKVCECKPCGYKNKVRKPCDCKQPKEQPKGKETKKKGKYRRNTSQINERVPSVFGDTGSENKNRTALPQVFSKKNCDCEICECVFCSDSEAQKQPENIKEKRSVYEKPCEKKYVSLLSVEPCDRSKCSCGEKKPSTVQNIIYSRQPKQSEEVILQKKESVTSEMVVSETEESPLDEDVDTQTTPLQSEVQAAEAKPVMSKSCYCSECLCDPCTSAVDIPQNEDEQGVEDVPSEVCENKLAPVLASKDEHTPPDKQKTGSEVDQAQGDKTKEPTCFCNNPQAEKVKPKLPCDCSKPCLCSPCPDLNVKNESPLVSGDADRAKSEIKSALDRISCTCNQAEKDFKPLLKQASNFESTVSKMKLKLNNLQQKCKDKDQIINAMTKDLRMRSQSGVFANLLNELAHPAERFVPDFNRTYVCDYLPKPRPMPGTKLQPKRSSTSRKDNRLEPILELDRYLPGGNEDSGRCRKNVDALGLEILDIRRVTIDSILIKWHSPCNLTGINGYQIFVNDELKYKVLSPNRTSAVLDALELSRSLEIMLFAMSTSGRCEPPALATYKI